MLRHYSLTTVTGSRLDTVAESFGHALHRLALTDLARIASSTSKPWVAGSCSLPDNLTEQTKQGGSDE